ncbi:MAG: M48 family metalloprotease [Proteobacteria bacterium]|nr:M48 family metalloprotease [Pseudomonadota bacterium]
MSYARTATWLAGLTAIFIGGGFALAGEIGFAIAVPLVVLANVAAYSRTGGIIFGRFIAREVNETSAPILIEELGKLANRANLPTPRAFIFDSDQPNAFATGQSPSVACVAVTKGLMRHLSLEQIRGVLAHELGHGVHQVLAAPQGALMSDTPLTLAETASVFGEMLTFQAMLKAEKNARRRRILLAGKVEDMMNTVIRQIAFHQFEERVHAERPKGELSAQRLGDIWMEVQRQSLGPAFRFDDDYRNFWAYIPHFLHAPFYVYAYAFGDCLVNSLYDVFKDGHPGFQGKYFNMLKAGGTLRHKELLAPFGLDASDPDFWQRGLGVISGFIDELESAF